MKNFTLNFVAAILFLMCCNVVNGQQVKPVPEDFVFAQDTVFYVNKSSGVEPFYYAGTNNYYLMYKPMEMVEDILDDMVDLNLKVVRMWFFMDGENFHDGHRLQSEPGVIYEPTMQHIDAVVAAAGERGLKVLPVFINYWSDFGGMAQYANWAGTSSEGFYSNESCKEIFKNYVESWITRENTVTGVTYKDDPTIFGWQLTNEARCTSSTIGDYISWATEMSAWIRTLDPFHMISMGDEGLMNYSYAEANANENITSDWTYTGGQGDYLALLDVPDLDYGTFHNYATDNWGYDLQWGLDWTRHHIKVSHAKNKPCVMEEYDYGIQAPWTAAKDQERASALQAYIELIEDLGMAGDHSWMLIGLNYFDEVENGYTLDTSAPVEELWLYRVKWGGDGHQYSKYDTYTAPVIRQHGQNMVDKNVLNMPGAFDQLSPADGATSVKVNATLEWESSLYSTSYDVVVATDAGLTNIVTSISDVTATSCLVSGLDYETTYYWGVTASNIRGSQEAANSGLSFSTQLPPDPVGDFSLQAPVGEGIASEGLTFTWQASENVDYYNLVVADNELFNNPVIEESAIVGESFVSDVSLEQAKTYYWKVTAINSLSQSLAQAHFTTELYAAVIDDFEDYTADGDLQSAWVRNTGGETFDLSLSNAPESGQEMRIDYSFSNEGYCGAQLAKNINLTGYEGIVCLLTGDGSGHELIIQLVEGDEYYEFSLFVSGTSRERVFANFDSFQQASWNTGTGNGELNVEGITGVAIYLGGNGGTGTIYIDELKADFEVPTRNANLDIKDEVLIYPNPASEVLFVDGCCKSSCDLLVELYDTAGILVRKCQFSNSSGNIQFNVSGLKTGLYFVKIIMADGTFSRRIVVK